MRTTPNTAPHCTSTWSPLQTTFIQILREIGNSHPIVRANWLSCLAKVLKLPIHRHTRFLLVSPHYPENVGACARAIKTMGFTELGLVRPSRLACPDHPMAMKMAVKSLDVLEKAQVFDNLDEAVVGSSLVIATTSRRGQSGILTPALAATQVQQAALKGQRTCIVFGNEKTGLTKAEVGRCEVMLRIPMAADQPSVNLAQATQIVAYELFKLALEQRSSDPSE